MREKQLEIAASACNTYLSVAGVTESPLGLAIASVRPRAAASESSMVVSTCTPDEEGTEAASNIKSLSAKIKGVSEQANRQSSRTLSPGCQPRHGQVEDSGLATQQSRRMIDLLPQVLCL